MIILQNFTGCYLQPLELEGNKASMQPSIDNFYNIFSWKFGSKFVKVPLKILNFLHLSTSDFAIRIGIYAYTVHKCLVLVWFSKIESNLANNLNSWDRENQLKLILVQVQTHTISFLWQLTWSHLSTFRNGAHIIGLNPESLCLLSWKYFIPYFFVWLLLF